MDFYTLNVIKFRSLVLENKNLVFFKEEILISVHIGCSPSAWEKTSTKKWILQSKKARPKKPLHKCQVILQIGFSMTQLK